jgi:hypothetical protein
MIRQATVAIVLLFASVVCQANQKKDQIDPAQYTETITVMAESHETKDMGTTYTSKPKTGLLGGPQTDLAGRPTGAVKTTATNHVQHYCQARATIKDITYIMNGRANAPCIPLGTFKAKVTNGQYIDVLVTEANGNQYSVGFAIASAEQNAAPQAVATSEAEAARQARIAKAVQEAKEKAERDNPPAPQQ